MAIFNTKTIESGSDYKAIPKLSIYAIKIIIMNFILYCEAVEDKNTIEESLGCEYEILMSLEQT